MERAGSPEVAEVIRRRGFFGYRRAMQAKGSPA